MMKLNEENIEEQILLYVDGELSAKQEAALLDWLKQHPDKLEMLEQYQQAKIPVETIAYEEKNDLLRKESVVKSYMVWKKSLIGIAAALLLALVLPLAYQWQKNEARQSSSQSSLATVKPPEKTEQNKSPAKEAAPSEKKPAKPTIAVRTQKRQSFVEENQTQNRPRALEDISDLPVAILQEHNLKPVSAKVSVVTVKPLKVEKATTSFPEPVVKQDILDKLVAAGERSDKLQGVNDLLSRIQDKRKDIVNGWETLKQSTVVLQLGNREIVFNQSKGK